jgi:VWFA-related protein
VDAGCRPGRSGDNVANPRLVVIIIDDGLIPPDPWVLQKAKAIAVKAVDQLGPNDLASIVFTKDNREPRDFTADRARLLTTIDRTSYGFDRRRFDERHYAEIRSWHTLQSAIGYLRGVSELRSMIIYVTLGWRDPLGEIAPRMAGLETSDLAETEASRDLALKFGAALGSARVAGIPVYGVSPLGLVAPSPTVSGNAGLPPSVQTSAGVGAAEATGMAEMLRNLSEATGGRGIAANNTPDRLIPSVFVENSLHYTLGYESPGPMQDGRYRSIEVRVNRPDVTVEPGAERMFFSPKPTPVTGTPTTRALSGLVPLADEPLRLAVAHSQIRRWRRPALFRRQSRSRLAWMCRLGSHRRRS